MQAYARAFILLTVTFLLPVAAVRLSAAADWTHMYPGVARASLRSVWGSGSSDVFAVGAAKPVDDYIGAVTHYDGTGWTAMDTSATSATVLRGVWGSSGSDVFAVGDGGVIIHYDGSKWSEMESSVDTSLHSVWGTSESNVYVGGTNVLLHYNGNSWAQEVLPEDVDTFAIFALWGLSEKALYAAGQASNTVGIILSFNGYSWSTCYYGNPVYGLWGSDTDDIFSVAKSQSGIGEISHFDGTRWELIQAYDQEILYGIWGNSWADVNAVGNKGSVYHFDGTTWSAADTLSTPLFSIWGSSASDIFVVGEGSIYHYEGSDETTTTTTAPAPATTTTTAAAETSTTTSAPLADPETTTTTAAASPCPAEEIYGVHSPEAARLRAFRDRMLAASPRGQKIIAAYYRHAPALQELLATNDQVRLLIKSSLDALLYLQQITAPGDSEQDLRKLYPAQ
ncbi:CFI-box-CTERM domain-containing protein [Thermodesulfobacteriota bacterium]